jgi:phosphonate transport system substrate-binding protein
MGIAAPPGGAFREPSSAEQDHGAEAVKLEDRRRGRLNSIGLWIGRLTVVALPVLCVGGTPALAVEELDLGMISDSPSKTIKLFTPLHDYLTSKGLPMGKIITTQSIGGMIDLIKEEKIDFVFESPYGAVQIMEATGAIPVLIREKDGIREYNSTIFVNRSSPIEDLDDLTGKIVVFEDPGSTSSYILPRNLLLGVGLELVESAQPIPGKVAYYFSRGDANVLAHVKLGRADAGGIDRAAVADLPQFRILSPESGYVPRHVLLVRDGVDYGDLKEALLNMAADPDASDVLTAVETPTGFSEFEGDPREIMDEVQATLGL